MVAIAQEARRYRRHGRYRRHRRNRRQTWYRSCFRAKNAALQVRIAVLRLLQSAHIQSQARSAWTRSTGAFATVRSVKTITSTRTVLQVASTHAGLPSSVIARLCAAVRRKRLLTMENALLQGVHVVLQLFGLARTQSLVLCAWQRPAVASKTVQNVRKITFTATAKLAICMSASRRSIVTVWRCLRSERSSKCVKRCPCCSRLRPIVAIVNVALRGVSVAKRHQRAAHTQIQGKLV
mmetsp:Transcript_92035/g.177410  ORF Transcript_92035/g.177410 Transcript_92035/m.177410 type:complete len:237 (+) Transcript_92035:315-1025(+)